MPDVLTPKQLKYFIRSDGYAWPGGYPLVLVMIDGEVIDAKCARENYRLIRNNMRANDRGDSWSPAFVDVHWEGEPLQCAHCNKDIESAYGVPNA